jgi:hypothetical protein
MSLKTNTYHIHKKLFSKANNITRSQTLEVICAAFGFKSYAALKSRESQIKQIRYFLYVPALMAMRSRLQSFTDTNISDETFENALNVIFSKSEYSYYGDEVELEESLVDSTSELHQALEAELEVAAAQTEGYAFDGAELTNSAMTTLPDGDLQLIVKMTASLSQIEGRMLSSANNIYDLEAVVKVPQISSTGYGSFEILALEILTRNSFHDFGFEDEL